MAGSVQWKTRLRAPHAAADQHREKVVPDILYDGVQPHPLVLEDSMKRPKTSLSRRNGPRKFWHGSTRDDKRG